MTILFMIFAGCAANPPVCNDAQRLRQQAKQCVGEQRAALEAQAAGLEDACARARANLWEQQRINEQRQRQ